MSDDVVYGRYEAGVYSKDYGTQLGQDLWNFLNSEENIIRMETATLLKRPAAEGIEEPLLETFGERVLLDRVKQMIGHMIRQIMERREYEVDMQNVRIASGAPFSRATRYKRRGDFTYHVFRSTSDPRQVALTASRDADHILPALENGAKWQYYRSFAGELRGRIAFEVPDAKTARDDIAKQGYHLYRLQRILRAAR
ncbi:MAG: hypothetical protein WB930_04180 [Syntrophobacteraceae bacterium]